MSAAGQATSAARRILISRHQDEYETLIREERRKRGLNPRTATGELAYLRQRVAELEKEVAHREENDAAA
jgi:hypothetical protein